jgi:hypothetical protein
MTEEIIVKEINEDEILDNIDSIDDEIDSLTEKEIVEEFINIQKSVIDNYNEFLINLRNESMEAIHTLNERSNELSNYDRIAYTSAINTIRNLDELEHNKLFLDYINNFNIKYIFLHKLNYNIITGENTVKKIIKDFNSLSRTYKIRQYNIKKLFKNINESRKIEKRNSYKIFLCLFLKFIVDSKSTLFKNKDANYKLYVYFFLLAFKLSLTVNTSTLEAFHKFEQVKSGLV